MKPDLSAAWTFHTPDLGGDLHGNTLRIESLTHGQILFKTGRYEDGYDMAQECKEDLAAQRSRVPIVPDSIMTA